MKFFEVVPSELFSPLGLRPTVFYMRMHWTYCTQHTEKT